MNIMICICDTVLSADVFESFKASAESTVSQIQLVWHAVLKKTG